MTKHKLAVLLAASFMLLAAGVPASTAFAGISVPPADPVASLVMDQVGFQVEVAALAALWQAQVDAPSPPSSSTGNDACSTGDATDPWLASLGFACAWMERITHLGTTPVATDECDLTGTVCVVDKQSIVSSDPYCQVYRAAGAYGPYTSETGVYLNRGTPDQFYAHARAGCGYWHLGTSYNYGFQAFGGPGSVTAQVQWLAFDNKPNPSCSWGNTAHAREATQVFVRFNDGAGTDIEIHWLDITVTPCNPALYDPGTVAFPYNMPGHACYTLVRVGTDVTDLGCGEWGAPPSPPHPSDFPYGNVLP